jgi:hypothetical protein
LIHRIPTLKIRACIPESSFHKMPGGAPKKSSNENTLE